ncbi:hypothetical protein [Paenibacillus pinihumi]|uniref:hypothetical protein n=1 Tax=Paenibacillus pinihumi TaxID=669462 RepID=UPI000413C704|nr:hypothetical protein [Paenibacillus pinihumi]
MKRMFIIVIAFFVSRCSFNHNGEIPFQLIYKGDLTDVHRIWLLDLAGSGQEISVKNKDSIHTIIQALSNGKYRKKPEGAVLESASN